MSWLLIIFAQNAFHLILSRIINGIVGGGIFAICPIYLCEVASDHVRGVLGSTLILSLNAGILLGFTFGTYFSFYMTPWFVIVLTILFGISFYFFPETPAYLMKDQNRMGVSGIVSERKTELRISNNFFEISFAGC